MSILMHECNLKNISWINTVNIVSFCVSYFNKNQTFFFSIIYNLTLTKHNIRDQIKILKALFTISTTDRGAAAKRQNYFQPNVTFGKQIKS